mmetsp:Transcript_302/g.552  ORF Transcript_302/g.552 Transcript_302/m.552 type:complete len:158 (-) Transcript_302:371-844(-)
MLINDPYDRCREPPSVEGSSVEGSREGTPPPTCRNVHGFAVERASRFFALGNMTYDAFARHPRSFCDRVQLYDLQADPQEQLNLVQQRPQVFVQLLRLLAAHVARVEAGTPPMVARARRASPSSAVDDCTPVASSDAGVTVNQHGAHWQMQAALLHK